MITTETIITDQTPIPGELRVPIATPIELRNIPFSVAEDYLDRLENLGVKNVQFQLTPQGTIDLHWICFCPEHHPDQLLISPHRDRT